MDPRVPLLAALLALPLLAAPAGAAVQCAYDRANDYVLGNVRVHHVSHECTYYDVVLDATVVDRLDRYDGYRQDLLDPSSAPHAFTYETHAVETRFRDGRTTFEHWTYLGTGPAYARHGYLEERDAAGRQKCHGAAEAVPGFVPGRVSVPRTPDYAKCLPPGTLA